MHGVTAYNLAMFTRWMCTSILLLFQGLPQLRAQAMAISPARADSLSAPVAVNNSAFVPGSLPSYFKTGVLDFESRVWAQTQIERVWYNHRIWPKENPGPKPLFETMVARELIERRAGEPLQYTAALKQFFNLEITPAMLQSEMDRMAKGTQDAATLRELFAALHDDPRLIAETLGRQTLADRLLRSNYSWDLKLHAPVRARANSIASDLAPFKGRGRADFGAGEGVWKSLGGEFHRHTFLLDEKADASPVIPGHEPDITRVKAAEFAAMKEKYASRGVGAAHASPLRMMDALPDENAGAIHPAETADGFVLQHAALITDSRIEIESIVIQKTSFDEWWNGVSSSLSASVVGAELSSAQRRPGILRAELSSAPTGADANATPFHLPEITAVAGCDQWISPSGLNNILPAARYNHTAVWTGTEMIVWGGNDGSLYLNTGGRYNPATDMWAPTSLGANLPDARENHTAVWTGNEMIIWGGNYINKGGRYNPQTNKWRLTSTGINSPAGRTDHAAVWTGMEMIIWGGGTGPYYNDGGRYNPSSDSWQPVSTGANVPSPRGLGQHAAVWTGSEMLVWGGITYTCAPSCGLVFYNTGGRYNPATDSWQPISTGANLPTARAGNTAVWSGSEMIVWGGSGAGWIQLNSGGRYNPATNSWLPTSTGANVPAARNVHVAVWSGSRMIVWGGRNCPGSPCGTLPTNYNSGGKYDPATDSWAPTSTGANVPAARVGPVAVWTGAEMVVWGGYQCQGNPCPAVNFNSGGRYNPNTDGWLPTSLGGNVPSPRQYHSSLCTGAEMIVWGGHIYGGAPYNTGGRYNLALDAWMPTSLGANVPSARFGPPAIWSGNEMIIWGNATTPTGGRYDPASDSWTPTSIGANVPSARNGHSAVWSGSEMIVWGGGSTGNTGSRYNPLTDSWLPTSTGANVPAARGSHSANWTGSEMIIWGGYASGTGFVNSGGRYNPQSNSWIPTDVGSNVPQGRYPDVSIWSGSEMIIWGGFTGTGNLNTGGRYNPVLNQWLSTSLGGNNPTARTSHSGVWTGIEMIVWGGDDGTQQFGMDSGGRYNPSADAWKTTSTGANSADHRYLHSAIWTGSSIIVWAGQTLTIPGYTVYDNLNSGGVYVSGAVASPANALRVGKSSNINLSWSNVYGSGSYNVKRCNPSSTACIPGTIVSTPTINQYSEPNDGLSHFYSVEAVNQCGATP